MLSPEAIAALTEELRSIEDQLRPYRTLAEKHRDIKSLLEKWAPSPAAATPADPFAETGVLARALSTFPEASGGAYGATLADALSLLTPDEPKALKIVLAARNYLAHNGGSAPFIDIFKSLPAELFGDMKHPREYARTALTRKGGEVGLVYEDADNVRLSIGRPTENKNPEAVTSGN